MTFESRHKNLNDAQRLAVDTIDGPLMIVAGPGTGKTELLSMRTANILKKTDTLPSNILCLTFTESGASAMRERLSSIIGADAYKVAIHTFHSFGTEIINRYSDFFYNGARFQPASELIAYEVMHSIFEQLEYSNPLASTMNGEYTYLKDVMQSISELKRSGLASDELLQILEDNERILDSSEKELAAIFAERISKTTKDALTPIAHLVAHLDFKALPPSIQPLREVLALSLSHAIDEADVSNSTKPVTAWRNDWMEKNDLGDFVFKDRKRIKKLRSLSFIYHAYVSGMQEKELFDFDDMVVTVVHAIELIDELRYNLQEQYLYIMVDEFQDTNLSQARILRSLADNPANEGAPNIMVVGDDDQAIYSFQGAELSNIMQFRSLYETTKHIELNDNYRSSAEILSTARDVIIQGKDRLENYVENMDKTLKSHHRPAKTEVSLTEFSHVSDERAWIAKEVQSRIKSGTTPSDITVLARRHHELVSLLPYFNEQGIGVNYERRENVLDSDVVTQLELLARIVHLLSVSEHEEADALLPELLSHPAWKVDPKHLWRLSLAASRQRKNWLEMMEEFDDLRPVQAWLVALSAESLVSPLEPMLDKLVGINDDQADFVSPLFSYFFSSGEKLDEIYINYLDALRTLRDKLREHASGRKLHLVDFIEFIDLQRTLDTQVVSVRSRAHDQSTSINLMTAHKAKGQEFEHVFIFGAVDSSWGQRVRTRSRLISYPHNLRIAPAGDSYDERLRLFYVAATRAKSHLSISYSSYSDSDSQLALASFFADSPLEITTRSQNKTSGELTTEAELAWYKPIVSLPATTQRELLASTLDNYKLSATHLNAFLDVTRGGPQHFLLHNLLRFPQSMSPNAAYGSAFHRTLQQTHSHVVATKKQRPAEDVLADFEKNLEATNLSEKDFDHYLRRGTEYLQRFLDEKYDSFLPSQKPELGFSSQVSLLGQAHLTGLLDLADIDIEAKTMVVTDYKTGKPSEAWKGKTDFEKIKLHKYKQQLMFYKLLVEHSRDYAKYTVNRGVIQFVEPTASDRILALETDFDVDELERFSRLVQAVWLKITTLDLPDTSQFAQDFSGILAFENDLLDD